MTSNLLPQTLANSPEDGRKQFERHVARAYPTIYRHAYRLLRNKSDAEEVTQDAFLRAWKHFDSFDGVRRFENWMLRIVTNLIIDRRRRRRFLTCSLDADITLNDSGDAGRWDPPDPNSDPAREVLDHTIDPAIERALGELSTTFRNVLVMADVEDCSYSEIAEVMNCPIGTVRSRLRRARLQMRRKLEAHGFTPASVIH